MWPEMWRKFMLICVLSGMTSITRVTWGELLESPRSWAMCEQCVAEAVAVANAHGQSFDAEFTKAKIQHLKGLPSDLTASMARDVVAGKPSELEAQVMQRLSIAPSLTSTTLPPPPDCPHSFHVGDGILSAADELLMLCTEQMLRSWAPWCALRRPPA